MLTIYILDDEAGCNFSVKTISLDSRNCGRNGVAGGILHSLAAGALSRVAFLIPELISHQPGFLHRLCLGTGLQRSAMFVRGRMF